MALTMEVSGALMKTHGVIASAVSPASSHGKEKTSLKGTVIMNPNISRRAMLTAIWATAGSAAILSYSGIRALGLEAGFHPILS